MQNNTVRSEITYNNVTVVTTDNQINVTQPVTNVVEVITPGPQGQPGDSGPFSNIGGIFTTTSSIEISSSISISGSINISNLINLTPQHPLPIEATTGSLAVSASTPPKPYFYDGTSWNALY